MRLIKANWYGMRTKRAVNYGLAVKDIQPIDEGNRNCSNMVDKKDLDEFNNQF
jgi:hypothetical protein